jgi:hypothetical protein
MQRKLFESGAAFIRADYYRLVGAGLPPRVSWCLSRLKRSIRLLNYLRQRRAGLVEQ